MKRTILFLFVAAFIFAGCEKLEDDRQNGHTGGEGLVGLLGFNIKALPETPMYVTLDFGKHHFAPSEAITTPHYFRIPGGYWIGSNNPYLTICGSTDSLAVKDTLFHERVIDLWELRYLGSPYELAFSNGVVTGEYEFWYEH